MARFFLLFTVALFAIIGFIALGKGKKSSMDSTPLSAIPIEIAMAEPISPPSAPIPPPVATPPAPAHKPQETPLPPIITNSLEELPKGNRIDELFSVNKESKLPFIQTVKYKSRIDWMKGRPAWISDYASHYKTSRHFIARSLNGKRDYFKQEVSEGDRFNVLNPDIDLSFHLIIDLSRCKLLFYAYDATNDTRTLLNTYDVGLGREDPSAQSGLLTPLGTYSLGEKIATYRPNTQCFHNGNKVEMIRIFGTRWIPFDQEIENTTAPAKGLGIHGVPWYTDQKTGTLVEEHDSVGKYDSDGCIRLRTDDIEEIFSIVITRKTTVQLVKDFKDAKLPGKAKG